MTDILLLGMQLVSSGSMHALPLLTNDELFHAINFRGELSIILEQERVRVEL